jgi:methylglutaconyl-CoA hydratase
VAEVWLNRPDLRNAFNSEVIAEVTAAFRTLGADPQLRAIVLGGRGKAFCAGGDLNWMRAMADYTWAQNKADADLLAEMMWTVFSCPVPVVGRMHGDCYAGGVGLAAACDVLVAAEGMHFCLSEARLGLLPATIGPYVMRALGEQASRRYFITAERFSAARAHALGFVHELATPDTLDAAWPRWWRRWWPMALRRSRPASGWCTICRAAPSTRRCATTPRAASPTSAPATKARKACRRS